MQLPVELFAGPIMRRQDRQSHATSFARVAGTVRMVLGCHVPKKAASEYGEVAVRWPEVREEQRIA